MPAADLPRSALVQMHRSETALEKRKEICRTNRMGFAHQPWMPTNLYDPEDNFDLNSSHVLSAMIRKFHPATREGSSQIAIWGYWSAAPGVSACRPSGGCGIVPDA